MPIDGAMRKRPATQPREGDEAAKRQSTDGVVLGDLQAPAIAHAPAAPSSHKQVGTYVGIITFHLASGYSPEQFETDMPGFAGAFTPSAIPGLLGKRWLNNDEKGVYGGCYLWKDEDAYLEFKNNGLWAQVVSVNPNFTNASMRGFHIIDSLTVFEDEIPTVGYIALVSFKLIDGYTEPEYLVDCQELKPIFKPGALPGLLCKRWLKSGDGVYGGCYFFKDEASFKTYEAEGPWAGAISVHPKFTGQTLEGFPVHLELTQMSDGQP